MFNSLIPNLIPNGSVLNGSFTHTINNSATTCQSNGFKTLMELDSNTVLNQSLINLLKRSFFEKKSFNWKPSKIELVVNTKLASEFEQIKNEFKSSAKEPVEYEEKHAFVIVNEAQVGDICLNGYSCPDNSYNVIGHSKSGVYLCKYPDVALKYNESKKFPDHQIFKMIIFKVCYGKQTLALVRKDIKLTPISATPNFNSHMSVIPPKEKDDIEVQFDHSQIYLYELDSAKSPSKRPRHCMPYGVITWSKGEEWPANFSDLDTFQLASNGFNEANENEPIDQNSINQQETRVDENALNNTNSSEIEQKQESLPDEARPENNLEIKKEVIESTQTADQPKEENTQPQLESPVSEQLNSDTATTSQERDNATIKTEVGASEQTVASQHLESSSPNLHVQASDAATNQTNQVETSSNALNQSQTSPTQTRTSSTPTSTTPNPTTAAAAASNPATTTTPSAVLVPATPTTYNKPMQNYFPKASAYTAYRHNLHASMAPYLYAAQGHQFSPYGAAIRLPYGGAHQLQSVQSAAALQALQNQQFLANAQAAHSPQMQQQVFLCRGPNGLTYVTAAAPNVVQQQLAVAQAQAQANAIFQQQAAAAVLSAQVQQQVASMPYQKYQTNQSLASINNTLIANSQAPVQQQQQQQQIIYQAAPQPANSAVQNKNPTTANQQQQQVPPPQSPKQQQQQQQTANQQQAQQQQQVVAAAQAANQYAQYAASGQAQLLAAQNQQLGQLQQLPAGFQGQQGYFAYAQAAQNAAAQTSAQANQANQAAVQQAVQQFYASTPSAQGAVATQQGYMLAAAHGGLQNTAANQQAVVAAQQQQQLQQLQQFQQQQLQQQQQQQQQAANQQLYGYQQLAGGAVNFNGLAAQQAQAAAGGQLGLASIPAGYQLIDYRQLQAAGVGLQNGAALQLDQLAAAAGLGVGAVPRPRIVNLRHHPYQRP